MQYETFIRLHLFRCSERYLAQHRTFLKPYFPLYPRLISNYFQFREIILFIYQILIHLSYRLRRKLIASTRPSSTPTSSLGPASAVPSEGFLPPPPPHSTTPPPPHSQPPIPFLPFAVSLTNPPPQQIAKRCCRRLWCPSLQRRRRRQPITRLHSPRHPRHPIR